MGSRPLRMKVRWGCPPRVLSPPPHRTQSWRPCLPGQPWASGWRSTDRPVPSPRGWTIGFSERGAALNRALPRCLSSRRCMRSWRVRGWPLSQPEAARPPPPSSLPSTEEWPGGTRAFPRWRERSRCTCAHETPPLGGTVRVSRPRPVSWQPLSRPKLTVLRARQPPPCTPWLSCRFTKPRCSNRCTRVVPTEAIQHILPRRDAPSTAAPGARPQSARRHGRPPASSRAAPPQAKSTHRPVHRASRRRAAPPASQPGPQVVQEVDEAALTWATRRCWSLLFLFRFVSGTHLLKERAISFFSGPWDDSVRRPASSLSTTTHFASSQESTVWGRHSSPRTSGQSHSGPREFGEDASECTVFCAIHPYSLSLHHHRYVDCAVGAACTVSGGVAHAAQPVSLAHAHNSTRLRDSVRQATSQVQRHSRDVGGSPERPCGLSLSPRVFTKVVEGALTPLREVSVRILNYLDDWLIVAQSREQLGDHRDLVLRHLSQLGLRVNWEKSKLSPVQRISFLGVELDSVSMTARLTEEGAQAVLNCLSSFRGRNVVPLKQFQRLLGHMASAAAVKPLRLLHMRPRQHWLHSRVIPGYTPMAPRYTARRYLPAVSPPPQPLDRPCLSTGRGAPRTSFPAYCCHNMQRAGSLRPARHGYPAWLYCFGTSTAWSWGQCI